MHWARTSLSLSLAIGLFAASSVARADALPPDAEDCQGKAVGTACDPTLGGGSDTGKCANSTCPPGATTSMLCEKDAADAGTDAAACEVGTPCLRCEVSDGGSGGTDSGTDSGSTGTDSGTTTTTTDGGGTTTPASSSDDSGCSVSPTGTDVSRVLVPLGLAMLVPFALRRRRKRK